MSSNEDREAELNQLREELRQAQGRAAEQYAKFVEEIKCLGAELRQKEAQLEHLRAQSK